MIFAYRLLLEHGANPNGSPKNLCTPLAMAALRGHSELVDLLCKYGADTENVSKLASGCPGKHF